jgi:ABC-type multidrug transport system fused ATPase/permease subunit
LQRARFKSLLYLLHPHEKRQFVILLLLSIGGSLLDILTIGIIPALISVVSSTENMALLNEKLAIANIQLNNQREQIIWGAISIMAAYLIKNAFITYLIYHRARIVVNIQQRLCFDLLVKYYNAPYQFHLNRNSNDLLAKVYDEARQVVSNLIMPGIILIMESITISSILVFLFAVKPSITFLTMLIFGFISFVYLKTIKEKSDYYGARLPLLRSDLLKSTYEGIHGLKDARVLNRESYFLKRIFHFLQGTSEAMKFQMFTSQVTKPFVETTGIVLVMTIVLYLGTTASSIASIIPVISLFGIAAMRMLPSVNQIVSGYSSIRIIGHTIDIVYKEFKQLEDQSTKTKEPVKESERIKLNNGLSIKNVRFRYDGTDKYVLGNLSVSIKRGDAVAFVGPSGSGKSTLADMILGLLKPESGFIKADEKDIFENLDAWRESIGYVPQFIFLTDDSIRRNIAFGIREEEIDETALWNAVKAAQLEQLIHDLPEGLQTEIGERGVRLSGGQRQRIGIARALYHNPEVLIFDEATSALDNLTEKYITEEINLLKGSRTIIIIAHRLSTVQNCDCIYFIKKGDLVAEGTYDTLLEKNSEFRQMAFAHT